MNVRLGTQRTVLIGPILDSTGAAKTDEVVASVLASKNGGNPTALDGSATLTHKQTGYYLLLLTANDISALGCLEISLNSTTNTMPVKAMNVMTALAWDALYAASGGTIPVSDSSGVTELLTRIPDATAGETGGLLIAGANAATTFATLTVTGATTFTGAVGLSSTLTVTGLTRFNAGVVIVNPAGIGLDIDGTTGGVTIGATAGDALACIVTAGDGRGVYAKGYGSGHGLYALGGATGSGLYASAGTTGYGIVAAGYGVGGHGLYAVAAGTGSDIAAAAIAGTLATLTTYTGNTPQTGDSYNVVKSGGAGDAAAIKAQTDKWRFTVVA